MNPNLLRNALCACTLSLSMVVALPARAAVDCAAPRDVAQRRACEAATQGVDVLRRYSERTRNIYHIFLDD